MVRQDLAAWRDRDGELKIVMLAVLLHGSAALADDQGVDRPKLSPEAIKKLKAAMMEKAQSD